MYDILRSVSARGSTPYTKTKEDHVSCFFHDERLVGQAAPTNVSRKLRNTYTPLEILTLCGHPEGAPRAPLARTAVDAACSPCGNSSAAHTEQRILSNETSRAATQGHGSTERSNESSVVGHHGGLFSVSL